MRYLIECHPTPSFFGSENYMSGNFISKDNLLNFVLFGISFSAGERLSDEEIKNIVLEVQNDPRTIERLLIDIEKIEIKEGSVEIILVASACVAAPVAAPIIGGIAVTGIALWAADKLFGGTLSEFGKRIANRILDKSATDSLTNSEGQDEIFDPAEEAENLAIKIAAQYNNKAATTGGGIRDGLKYRYDYKFYNGTRPEVRGITIWVDPKEKGRAEYKVW